MTLSAQRGAIPLELDRHRLLFYDAAATFLMVEKFGRGVAAKLYAAEFVGPDLVKFEMLDAAVFQYALWAGLLRDGEEQGDALTLEQAVAYIRPWTFNTIFTAVIQAYIGANAEPPVKAGNAPAAGTPAIPSAPKPKAAKTTTLRKRSGLRSQR